MPRQSSAGIEANSRLHVCGATTHSAIMFSMMLVQASESRSSGDGFATAPELDLGLSQKQFEIVCCARAGDPRQGYDGPGPSDAVGRVFNHSTTRGDGRATSSSGLLKCRQPRLLFLQMEGDVRQERIPTFARPPGLCDQAHCTWECRY